MEKCQHNRRPRGEVKRELFGEGTKLTCGQKSAEIRGLGEVGRSDRSTGNMCPNEKVCLPGTEEP